MSFQILMLEKLIKMSDGQKVVTRIIMLKKKRGREWKGNEVYQNEYENEAEDQGSSPDLK